jgi:hypothetical protein
MYVRAYLLLLAVAYCAAAQSGSPVNSPPGGPPADAASASCAAQAVALQASAWAIRACGTFVSSAWMQSRIAGVWDAVNLPCMGPASMVGIPDRPKVNLSLKI